MENVATEEFISRTEALKDFEENNARNPNWTPQRVKTLLLRQAAANVAEVVRCKDCKLWDSDPDTYGKDTGPEGKCMKSFERMPADGFCSYGERREE